MGHFVSQLRNQWMGALALFVALGGTAYAAIELEKDDVTSKHIKNAGVKGKDIADNAVTSPKVANGSLLGEDFAAGQLPQGERGLQGERGVQGERGLQGQQGVAGTARAYGYVAANGTITRSKNIVGNATNPIPGVYCVTLDPSIPVAGVAPVAQTDYSSDTTSISGADIAFAKWASNLGGGGLCPQNNSVGFVTGEIDGDTTDNTTDMANQPGDSASESNQPFTFIIP